MDYGTIPKYLQSIESHHFALPAIYPSRFSNWPDDVVDSVYQDKVPTVYVYLYIPYSQVYQV